MQHNKDKVLGDLGRKILSTPFSRSLDLSAEAMAKLGDAHTRNAHRHVTVLNSNANLVSIYCGGAVRCFATFGSDYVSACRIADMLIYKFGRWRLQTPRDLRPTDFNFSAEQAAADLKSEAAIAEIIDALEKHLRSIGALLDPEHPERRPETMRRQKTGNPLLQELLRRIEALEKKVGI